MHCRWPIQAFIKIQPEIHIETSIYALAVLKDSTGPSKYYFTWATEAFLDGKVMRGRAINFAFSHQLEDLLILLITKTAKIILRGLHHCSYIR